MKYPFIPLRYARPAPEQVQQRSRKFFEQMDQRRSVRDFSPDPVTREVIEDLVRAASTAPSGAHRQPWRFVAVANPAIKSRIREAAEKEERLSYGGRMPEEWREALAPLGTDANKPFLEIAPWLVVMFRQDYGIAEDGGRTKNYYIPESVGIAAGMFITAVHQAGLVTLTHTPSPMRFLQEILERPPNEKAYLLLPVGYPAAGAEVPELRRKALDEVLVVKD